MDGGGGAHAKSASDKNLWALINETRLCCFCYTQKKGYSRFMHWLLCSAIPMLIVKINARELEQWLLLKLFVFVFFEFFFLFRNSR